VRAMFSAAIFALVLLVAPSADAGIYGLGVTGEYGNAYLPPTGEAGTTTMLTYHEHGGLLGAFLLFVGEAPAEPRASTTTTTDLQCKSDGAFQTCTTYEVTTTTTPSQAEIEQFHHDMDAWGPTVGAAIMRGEAGQELEIELPLRALGGNTSGFMLKLFRPIPGTRGILSVGQFAFGWMTFHDVKTRMVRASATELTATEQVGDHTFKYAGIPCRFQVPFGRTGFGAHLQFDFNLLSIVMDQASPVRAGAQWVGSHVMLSVEGVASGFRPDGASISAEAALAF
jgi:hypothetical protein